MEIDDDDDDDDDDDVCVCVCVYTGLEELRRRKRAVETTIATSVRDCETLRRRIKEMERATEARRARVAEYEKVIKEGETSLERIHESSEYLLSALATHTRALGDDGLSVVED
jgi:chromosome segregation ATPase